MKQNLFDLALAIMIAAAVAGCSGKKLMKECRHLANSVYECEEI